MSDTGPASSPATPAAHSARRRAASWARQAMKVTAAGVDLVRPHRAGVVVLIYHRVGRRSSMAVDLPTSLFEDQMAELAASGRVITLDRAVDLLSGASDASGTDEVGGRAGPVAPPGPVVLTFDDGTADLADLATPILHRHGLPATLYLATDFVDRGVPFPDDGLPLSWAGVRELADSGLWSIESHTHTHALLDRAPDASVGPELDRSIDLIAEHTDRRPEHFAYPKALPGTPAADRAVRDRFRSAALAGTLVNRFGSTDCWRLARTPIQVDDGLVWFRRKAAGGMRTEDDLRRMANRVRYASART